ncbi:hypothetical protein H6S82_14145 [Planktothrix sp. FACHB-1355]|uniref:Uncharacterized protein n=1 Tax=Aerosakkonema funiforme FACHB-1375 TaxID=2949571 RepID=A0A926VJ00_9CYAN|nr:MULTISPECIES: hypothetical protein [Oscillatoriales]MBD2184744.1 hypothetical protein [Aerosakkonema funiforme FACHB-1375]MBD3559991.1 hypothetical protein [Planktothrix sp. FACHB-1355]
MTKEEIEAALQAAFDRCDAASCPLTETQKQILLQVAENLTRIQSQPSGDRSPSSTNPLDELTDNEQETFLEFVREQEREDRSWKFQLMNDWLNNRTSGEVQFIRDRYGLQWLNRVKQEHLAEYIERTPDEILKLKVGDRIEVSNSLWEWVQENGPCSREWVSCTVIKVDEIDGNTTCTIRFDNGSEYEIQGIYEWNRYNWRWPSG